MISNCSLRPLALPERHSPRRASSGRSLQIIGMHRELAYFGLGSGDGNVPVPANGSRGGRGAGTRTTGTGVP